MAFNIYYSYYQRLGKRPESPHQLELQFHAENGNLLPGVANSLIVDRLFIIELWRTKIELLEEYLDFHFNKYTGEKYDFLRYSEEKIHKEIKRRNSPHPRDKYILEWIEKKRKQLAGPESSIKSETNIKKEQLFSTTLKLKLKEYKFFDLKMVKELSDQGREKMMEFLFSNELPYQIAMMNYLGFIKYLSKEHFNTKKEIHIFFAEIFNTTERSIRGNINVLNEKTKENKNRYTAHLHMDSVQYDYLKLK